MIRLILSCLIALSFIGSAPAVAAMAQPAPPQASECTMKGEMPDQPADHGKLPCCTSDCTMAGAAGLTLPSGVEVAELKLAKAPLVMATVKELASLDWATVDPPPRA